jgi:hypothetical protein
MSLETTTGRNGFTKIGRARLPMRVIGWLSNLNPLAFV